MASFVINVEGVKNFDEQCNIQSTIQDAISKMGYKVNSSNFRVNFIELTLK